MKSWKSVLYLAKHDKKIAMEMIAGAGGSREERMLQKVMLNQLGKPIRKLFMKVRNEKKLYNEAGLREEHKAQKVMLNQLGKPKHPSSIYFLFLKQERESGKWKDGQTNVDFTKECAI